MHPSPLLFCLLLLLTIPRAEAGRMVVFGDSLSDGGFWFGARFTDPGGLLWHEYLADRIGQERAVTGFLGSSGLNLAVGGSLAEDLSGQITRYKNRATWQPGDLCTVWTGGNDIRGNPNGDMSAVAASVGEAIAELAAAGVDHFVVPNLPDLGAIPESLGDDALSAARTTATMAFNSALAAELDTRAATLGVTIEQLDVFAIYNHILFYRQDFGLLNITDPLDSAPAADPETYAFWDDIHPTTRSHALLAAAAQALIDENEPLEIISWAIDGSGALRQTWFADPASTYTIRSGTRPEQLTNSDTFTGLSAYTTVIPAPGTARGFYRTERE